MFNCTLHLVYLQAYWDRTIKENVGLEISIMGIYDLLICMYCICNN